MNKKALLVLLFLSFFAIGNNSAQQVNVDSLENLLKTHITEDTAKVNLLNKITLRIYEKDAEKARNYSVQAGELADKLNFPKGKAESVRLIGLSYIKFDKTMALTHLQSALKMAEDMDDKFQLIKCHNAMGKANMNSGRDSVAIMHYQKALTLAETLDNKKEMAKCLSDLSFAYYLQGKNKMAIEGFNKVIVLLKELGDQELLSSAYIRLGTLYATEGNLPMALECFQNCLKISEDLNNKVGVFMCINSIGNIYSNQKNLEKSLEYRKKALKIAEELKDKARITMCLNNLGIYYFETNNPKAMDCFQKVLVNGEELHEPLFVFGALEKIGNIYENQGDFVKAMNYYQKALKVIEKNGMKASSSLALYYIGRVCLKQKKYTEALRYSLRSLDNSIQFEQQKEIKRQLSEIYAAIGDYKKAYTFHNQYKVMNDSIYNESNIKKFAELEYTYKFDKEKQAIELEQKKKDAIMVAQKRQQTIILFSFVIAFILISLLAFYIYRSYLDKKKSNILLTKQKEEIEVKNQNLVLLNEEITAQREEISSQRDEIETQRDMVVLQKDRIQAQKNLITDSIDYAKHIQQALLPTREYTEANLQEHFILFKPKDIVSGDFYWSTRVNEYLIVTVADCTGHGIPGAFMSILGISFLNEIVGKKGVVRASDILDQLRNSVIDALKQKWRSGVQNDGIDLALIVINTQTGHLQYAGAHNPLYIVNSSKELNQLKPDNQTVAINIKMRPFTNHEMQLSKGDCIYLASDGYHDQFGGPQNSKFKKTQLMDLILAIADKPMIEQGELLDSTFEHWKGKYEQTDDVTIVGMRF